MDEHECITSLFVTVKPLHVDTIGFKKLSPLKSVSTVETKVYVLFIWLDQL